MEQHSCYHCGDSCGADAIHIEDKLFCCNGCKTVYEIFSENGLHQFYELNKAAGSSPKEVQKRFQYLEAEEVIKKIITFDEGNIQIVQLNVPKMHCSSCIWVLENLHKLHPGIQSAQVDFPRKTVRITYYKDKIDLRALVELMTQIGYEPSLNLAETEKKAPKIDRRLLYQLGVAGFSFGNVMLLSFPEYFELSEYWLDQFKPFFRGLMFLFSLPVVFYAGQDYFISAWKGIKSKIVNIDIPIALGIFVLFLRSSIEVFMGWGSGFFDSLTGLVFFLLLGKFFQEKTYSYLSFERDYKSYFPIAVTVLQPDGKEKSIEVNALKKGDKVLLRNEEIIPVDGVLQKGKGLIDYSFVTGEAVAVPKTKGDSVFAGGKQLGGTIEIEVLETVAQSYLTQLWSNHAFDKNKANHFQNITNSIGKRFTIAVLTIATVSSLFWLWYDPSLAANVFTAVLIIACPCAIALAAPFTLGNLLRIFGKKGFYARDTNVLERLAKVNHMVFDKTGTLTTHSKLAIDYEGMPLDEEEKSLFKTTLRGSNHPLSRALYTLLKENNIVTLDEFEEQAGKGIYGRKNNQTLKAGAASYVGLQNQTLAETSVHISTNNQYKGKYVFKNTYREGLTKLVAQLKKSYQVYLLSGDNDGEKSVLEKLLPFQLPMFFNQSPEEKLAFVKQLQESGKTMMIGDGLNDAGALAQSDVGIALAEDVNVFTPACDVIMDAKSLELLPIFMNLSQQAMRIIQWSFLLSLTYNLCGLYFAVTGQLAPVIAAILMPLSSISIVTFTTMMTNFMARKINFKS